jgi:molybdopterin synthase catalytic subunit
MIELTDQPLDAGSVHQKLLSVDAGATVVFTGTTRRLTAGRETVELTYECYRELAERELHELESLARSRWPILECLVLHRLGTVPLGEASVIVGVSAAHRDPAFAAARWLIDTLKERVPIWKQEHWSDGSHEWIHPGMPPLPRPSEGAGNVG